MHSRQHALRNEFPSSPADCVDGRSGPFGIHFAAAPSRFPQGCPGKNTTDRAHVVSVPLPERRLRLNHIKWLVHPVTAGRRLGADVPDRLSVTVRKCRGCGRCKPCFSPGTSTVPYSFLQFPIFRADFRSATWLDDSGDPSGGPVQGNVRRRCVTSRYRRCPLRLRNCTANHGVPAGVRDLRMGATAPRPLNPDPRTVSQVPTGKEAYLFSGEWSPSERIAAISCLGQRRPGVTKTVPTNRSSVSPIRPGSTMDKPSRESHPTSLDEAAPHGTDSNGRH